MVRMGNGPSLMTVDRAAGLVQAFKPVARVC